MKFALPLKQGPPQLADTAAGFSHCGDLLCQDPLLLKQPEGFLQAH